MRTAPARSLILNRAMAPVWALLLGAAAVIPYGRSVQAQAGQLGTWATLPYTMPINPVHLALMHDGNVLIVAGSGNLATETTFRAALWNRQTGAITTQTLDWDMFCNGIAVLPDGRVFINGGNLRYDPFYGERRSAAYDPATGLFSDLPMMAHGRWYPTVTALGDGRMMTFSGSKETGGTNTSVEIYTPGVGWSPEYPAGWTPPLYPRLHLVPDGRVFYSGSGTASRFFDPATKTWSARRDLLGFAKLRYIGLAAALARRRLSRARDGSRRREPGAGDHGTHRSLGSDAAVAAWSTDVAGADSVERHHSPEWPGPRDGWFKGQR